jgi:hypothetical protein
LVLPLVTVWLICHVHVLCQSYCERNEHLVHRSFHRKLNLCSAVFGLFCVKTIFLIHHGQKRKRINLSVKQKLELIEKLESRVSVARVCEEYGHLDLTDIRQYQTPPPPN